MWAVELLDAAKTYGKTIQALRGVNVQVGRGEIFGLLGPNGAGKSTLVKIMMTVIKPDRVRGTVLGQPVGHRATMARIGYLPEAHRFPAYLTGAQLLDYFAALAKVSRSDRRGRAARLLERVGMSQWANTKISKYSKGMLQRLGIAQALMNDPDLVVLDEPTDGLDPIGRRHVRELLLELKAAGKTIFLNSHLLSELEQVCDRVVILVAGSVAKQGTLGELMQHTLEYRIVAEGDLSKRDGEIKRLGGRIDGDTITLDHQNRAKVNEVIDLLRSGGHLIESVTPKRFSLEDIFVEAMGHATTPDGGIPMGKPVARPS
ncbi:MAG: ABC transporter ATP-binding protein [Phycisphaerales bacterium]|nr:ABC transporter ATP-binding protein [Phycisphaerales bacterium]